MEEDRYVRITLRLPRDLHAQMERKAGQSSKSLNAQIVANILLGEVAESRYEQMKAVVSDVGAEVTAMAKKTTEFQRIAEFDARRIRDLEGQLAEAIAKATTATLSENLIPTIVRLERDIARLEVDRDFDLSLVRMLVRALNSMLEKLAPDEREHLLIGNIPVSTWVQLAEGRIAKQASLQDAEAAFERLKKAEATVRATFPAEADPMWEQMRALRTASSGVETDVKN